LGWMKKWDGFERGPIRLDFGKKGERVDRSRRPACSGPIRTFREKRNIDLVLSSSRGNRTKDDEVACSIFGGEY